MTETKFGATSKTPRWPLPINFLLNKQRPFKEIVVRLVEQEYTPTAMLDPYILPFQQWQGNQSA